MALYRDFILPHLIELSMRHAVATECRSRIVPGSTGRVLEVGVGSGLNLPFYGAQVDHVYGIDPSLKLLQMARRRIGDVHFGASLIRASAEDIPLAPGSVDTVVITWTLCSIADPLRALREMRRVMKPGGRVLFVEHGRAADANIEGWQRRLNPLWRFISGGCNLNRNASELLGAAGFEIIELRTRYLAGPRLLTFTYEGKAA